MLNTKQSALRVVSLAPNATSTLCAIGARRQLVGVTRWCPDVADVGKLPRLGDCWRVESIDAIAKLRPSLIVGSVPFHPEAVRRARGVPPGTLLSPRRSRRTRRPRVFSQLDPQSQHAEARVGLAPRRWKGVRGGIRAALCHRRYGSVAACCRTGQWHRAIASLHGKRAIARRKLGRCAARLGVDFGHHSCGFLVASGAIYSLAKLYRFRRSSLRGHWLGLDQT